MASLLNMSGGGLLLEKLPYDAEIEYLESTGTQMIVSNVTFAEGLHITADALYTGDYSKTQILFAPSANGGYWCGNINYGRWGVNANGYGDSSIKTRVEVYYSQNNTKLYLNGTSCGGQYRYSMSSYPPIAIFDSYNTGYKSKAKLYYILIQDSEGQYLFEGIPVRVGTTGYLYDKVSGTLFGNAGTGSFILGPDKTN